MSSPGKGRRFLPAFYSKRQKIYDTIVFLYAIQTQYILRTLHLFVLSIKRISLQNVSNVLFDGHISSVISVSIMPWHLHMSSFQTTFMSFRYQMYHYFLGPCCLVDHYRSIRVVSKYCLGLQSSWSFSSLKSHTKAQCTDVVTRRKQILVYLFIVIR